MKTNQWTEIDSFKFDSKQYDLFNCNKSIINTDLLFMTGGCYFTQARRHQRTWSKRVTCYSPVLDTWIDLNAMQKDRVNHYPFVYDGFLFVAGGDTPTNIDETTENISQKHTIERFDHIFGEWLMVRIALVNNLFDR